MGGEGKEEGGGGREDRKEGGKEGGVRGKGWSMANSIRGMEVWQYDSMEK